MTNSALRDGTAVGSVGSCSSQPCWRSAACADDRDRSVLDPTPVRVSPLEAAVQVRVSGCSLIDHLGQGSMIGARLVLTSAHVVAGGTAIGLTTADGAAASGTVVHLDPDLDLALVETDRPIGRPLAIGRADPGDIGTVVVRRDERLQTLDVGVVRPVTIRTEDIYIQGTVLRPGYELDATIEPGDSGGVVVVDGRAVAVVWSRSRQEPKSGLGDRPQRDRRRDRRHRSLGACRHTLHLRPAPKRRFLDPAIALPQ